MLTFVAIAARYRPRWLVWENVPGVLSSNEGRDFGTFLGLLAHVGYGFAYRVLDAQFFGVAQRRRRVFVVGCLGDWRRAAAVLFERQSLSGHPAPSRRSREDVAGTLTARTTAGGGLGTDFEAAGGVQAFGGNNTAGPIDVSTSLLAHGTRLDFETETLIATHEWASDRVRRLLPVECERLQGFADGWTDVPYRGKPASDKARYTAIGNSWAVPLARWIGRRIEAVEEIAPC